MAAQYQVAGSSASAIAGSIEAGVRSGALAAGESLPPVRTLAADLGVSPATVASAYQTLRQRGVLETAGRNGTRVRPRPPVAGGRAMWQLGVPAHALDLLTGSPDRTLQPRLADVLANLPDEPQLTDLARAAFERDGLDMSAASVGICGGALDAIERVLTAHCAPGDRIAIEDPGWANLLDLVAAMGMAARPMLVDEEGPTPTGMRTALAGGARAVVVTSRAHNPTGASVSASRAAQLRAVLAEYPDVLLIEDDFAAQLSTLPLAPLAGAVSRWAFVRSVSKPYGSDLRVSTVAGDPETIARVAGRQRLGTGWVSTILQRAVVGLWTSPEVDALVARAREEYEERRFLLVTALRERGLAATGRSGLNVWVPVPDETAAVAQLREDGYAVAPGALFRQATPPAVRITISRLSLATIPPLADAVARAATAPSLRAATW